MFESIDQLLADLPTPIRLLVFVVFSALAHLVVFLIRRGSALLGSDGKIEHQKLRSIIIADVTLIGDAQLRDRMVAIATERMNGVYKQYPGILISNPSVIRRLLSFIQSDLMVS